jgi:hypothetical protein
MSPEWMIVAKQPPVRFNAPQWIGFKRNHCHLGISSKHHFYGAQKT